MPEHLSKVARSRTMAAVKSRDTKPELIVRRLAHSLGYRFRLHRRDLPGTPDLVFSAVRKIVDVHGCFWHSHACQRRRKPPVHNAIYWSQKLARNAARDRANRRRLRRLGWRVLIVWECQTRDIGRLTERLIDFLSMA